MNIRDILTKALETKASDVHITVMNPPIIRVDGSLQPMDHSVLKPEDTKYLVYEVLTEYQQNCLKEKGEIDVSFAIPQIGRFRVNAYLQRGTYGMALRVVNIRIPTIEELGIPSHIAALTRKQRGLILVTGPTGSGKSTTLAAMIDLINKERKCHVLTLEDPIEYLHKHQQSIVNQREVGLDTKSFANGLRSALRQDPDVILVGEMRDLETMAIAITAAETGHLVLSTLHTIGAAKTVDRILDVFPPHQQQQVRIQLSSVIEGIISQQIMPKKEGSGRVAAFEIMTATPAIRNLVREGKTHQIQTSVQTGSKYGMITMDDALINLVKKGVISKETCATFAQDSDFVQRNLKNML
ncbi:twitching motility protein PilT [Tindallia magadiensis]|uniref:Twitching motility protein PilT n=1 Tax=Tindallia magadiensis TaxID=69895 RepID=A0A1I3ACS1_9FIRM|nr:type IV pilus twitching motility protein PilT [Tindallia magadiensis]SFH47606.1 twitching motility protein PilT [Tindallia magadiensis]